ncbi:hypothetical protein NE237_006639 [Protea cynaroides]|uniref:Uncharacterized protein n=1 Tax=Protea cynaroides TaxID=273540 RepID=A0A9Q0QVD0_9MAGN|nr:hypothetical protein NE237_006639 [Protea cynaroides]
MGRRWTLEVYPNLGKLPLTAFPWLVNLWIQRCRKLDPKDFDWFAQGNLLLLKRFVVGLTVQVSSWDFIIRPKFPGLKLKLSCMLQSELVSGKPHDTEPNFMSTRGRTKLFSFCDIGFPARFPQIHCVSGFRYDLAIKGDWKVRILGNSVSMEERGKTERVAIRNMKLHETPKPEATTKQKERHIVTWTQEEDDILREQIGLHGTDNWTIIAAKFKDKTTRQCRRRWYTYLNTDCKKGGWSPEEDMILCEAQKLFGNRWTEISKVVSGRTDNAVKNRFSTLCKKRAKHEALSKENNISCINPNNKRERFPNEFIMNESSDSTPPHKKMRTQILNLTEYTKEEYLRQCRENHGLRPPFAVLVQNFHNVGNSSAQQDVNNNTKAASNDVAADDNDQGTFLRRDDSKITALMQQADLLSSLALKVNTDNSNQSLENAWKELQDFLSESKDSDLLRYRISEMDFLPEDYKDLVEDLASGNMGSQQSWRQADLYEESPGSSEYSTESTLQSHAAYDNQQHQAEVCSLHQDDIVGSQLPHTREAQNSLSGCDDGISTISTQAEVFISHEGSKEDGVLPILSKTEFSSPLQVTPLFQSLAAEIPSPKFSESERNFLLKTLGLGSPPLHPSTNPSQPPPCRRALLDSL